MPITIVTRASLRLAPVRRIVGRERSGNQVTDRLECGHTITTRYTGWQTRRKCPSCAEVESRG